MERPKTVEEWKERILYMEGVTGNRYVIPEAVLQAIAEIAYFVEDHNSRLCDYSECEKCAAMNVFVYLWGSLKYRN